MEPAPGALAIDPIDQGPCRILNSQFQIMDQHLKLSFKFNARSKGNIRRQQDLRRFMDSEQDRLPERIDILIPELLWIAIPAAEHPEAGLQFFDAEGRAAESF